MKKLMYLAITFFTFIFSFIAPIKNNFNINNNNYKIVETKGVKRAFENAPTKTNNLPSFNKEFKIFFNLSNRNDLINFATPYLNDINIPYDNEQIPYIVFYGEGELELDNQILPLQVIMNFSKIETFEQSLNFSCLVIFGEQSSVFTIKVVKSGDVYIVNLNDNIVSEEDQTSEEISFYNEFFSKFYVKSFNKYLDVDVNNKNFNNYIYGYDLVSSSAVPGLISTISSIATGLLSLLISLFSSVVAIFWNVSNNTPTFLGVVILFVVAVPITYWVINFVIGLIRKIRLTRGK